MKSRQKLIGFFILCIFLGVGVGFGVAFWNSQANQPSPILDLPKKEEFAPIPSAHLLFVGDLMVDRGVENSVKNNMSGDFSKLFEHIGEYFASTDGVFLNLEGPVTDKGTNAGSRFSFAMDQKILPVLKANNIKMVSFANNHIGDRSITGFVDTLTNLNNSQIPYTGAGLTYKEATTPRIITINGLTIGFIGCTDVGPEWLKATESTPGVLLCSDSHLSTIITAAKEQVDFLVVSAHWGVEYKPRNTHQQNLAHAMVDAGADMVIGHHPHVIESTEWYKDKFITYSLGNFIFDQYFSRETMHGLLVDAVIEKDTIKSVALKVVELDPNKNKYQPMAIRDAVSSDFITRGTVASQTCPSAVDATTNLWLVPVGPDRDIGYYTPKNLIPMDNRMNVQTTANCLVETAANALIDMNTAMEEQGLKLIMTSGFRNRGTQEYIHNSSTTTQAAQNDLTLYPSVALPGHSEHQLGMAVDLKSGSDSSFSYENFKNSPEYAWLTKHAAEYGFVQSYKEGTQSITGYIPEAWHWRYVGTEHAQAIINEGTTPYEYLKMLEDLQ